MIEYDLLRLVCQIGGIDVLRQLFYGKKISISVQEHIITILLEYGKEKAISILEELIKGTNRKLDDMIKAYIASELARCGGRDQFPLIESIFNEIHGDDWRQWIIDGISECRDVESLLLLERLTDKSNKNSLSLKTIVSLIGKHTNKYPVDTLKQLIKKVDIFSQVRIAAFIGMAGEKTLALLLLRQIYAEATDSLDKVEIALEIIKFGDKSYVPLLKNLFTEESEHWRRDRILDLLYYGLEHSDLIVILKELFNEQVDRDVKELVACYLGLLGDKSVKPILFNSLQNPVDPEEDLISSDYIFEASCRIADKYDIPVLINYYEKQGNSDIRRKIIRLVANIADSTSVELVEQLEQLYNEKEHLFNRYDLIRCISRSGGARIALKLLKQLLEKHQELLGSFYFLELLFYISETSNMLIFQKRNKELEFMEITERYTF